MTSRSVKPFSMFLSHRYESPDVNLFFCNLLFSGGSVQFEVDKGTFTSVTRIERAVRAAEAFVGIYSLPPAIAVTSENLLKYSRYFRFELDVAVRARKPGLIFVDDRYGEVLPAVAGMEFHYFDSRELSERSISPKGDLYLAAFKRLSKRVFARRKLKVQDPLALEADQWERNRVVLLLSTGIGYSEPLIEGVRARLKAEQFAPFIPENPLSLDLSLQSEVRRADFVVVDAGDPASAPLAAYLHGLPVPLLRLAKAGPEISAGQLAGAETLFGPFEVGYRKDILRWKDEPELLGGIQARARRIREQQILVRTGVDAASYFRGAAQRSERVFLSYSSGNADYGDALATALKSRFENVFNYKDTGALTASLLWEEELYQKLADCKVGVALYSKSYFASKHCRKEAAALADRSDSANLALVGVRLEQDIELPPHLTPYQNIRGWQYENNIDGLVDEIMRSVNAAAAFKGSAR